MYIFSEEISSIRELIDKNFYNGSFGTIFSFFKFL